MVTAKTGDIAKALESIVGKGYVSTSEVDCALYGMAGQARQQRVVGKGDVVVMPGSVEEVAKIVALANKMKVPIVPQGGVGQDACSGIPLQGGICMPTDRMDKIIEINEENMVAVTEAGCSMYKLMYELNKKGLRFPIGPLYGSGPQAGGQVGDNAIGCFSCKYGTQGDLVVGLEVVLPTGEITTVGIGAYKEGHGHWWKYTGAGNVVDLFVESRGGLGVITKVAWGIVPDPKYKSYIGYGWPLDNLEGVARVGYEIQLKGAFEMQLFNKWVFYWDLVDGSLPPFPENVETIFAIIQDGNSEDEVKAKEAWTREICEANGGIDLGKFTEMMYGPPYYVCFAHYLTLHSLVGKDKADMKQYVTGFHHPTLKFPDYYRLKYNIMEKYGLLTGKGTPTWLAWFEPPAAMVSYPMWAVPKEESAKGGEVDREFAAELMKMGAVPYCMGPIFPQEAMTRLGPQYELMKRIKKLLDPNNIMNPGQLF